MRPLRKFEEFLEEGVVKRQRADTFTYHLSSDGGKIGGMWGVKNTAIISVASLQKFQDATAFRQWFFTYQEPPILFRKGKDVYRWLQSSRPECA